MNKTFKQLATTCALSLPLVFGSLPAQAEENLWLYTKGTDTRPKGSFELKISDIWRVGKDSGQYSFHDIRPEIEYGITDRLTVGAEIMIFDHDYSVDDADLNPMFETQDAEGGRFDKTQVGGYELTLKYNILSPYKDAIGLSVAAGFEDRQKYRLDGSDTNQKSYVGTLMLQKNWLDNTLTLAGNFKTELERRKAPDATVLEEEIAFDMSVGVAYRFMPKHFIGLEYRRQQDHLNPYENGAPAVAFHEKSEFDLTDWQLGTRHQYGEYIGPSYHYAEKDWWVTAGILFQVNGGGSSQAFSRDNRNWDEHEEMHIGISYGYEF